jgi:tetratricopeptide (TPR) repeat protein
LTKARIVSRDSTPRPALEACYARFLQDENTAEFIRAVAQRYTLPSLVRLITSGNYVSRRAAAFAITFLGDYSHNVVLGEALHDGDRGVRMLADNGIRQLWRRDGNAAQQRRMAELMRMNVSGLYEECLEAVGEFLEEAPWFAEAWNQRAIARFAVEQFAESANDCHQTLELNPYHFPAAVGMAHAYLEMEDPFAALECFRRALALNPDLEEVRVQINYLERTLEGK